MGNRKRCVKCGRGIDEFARVCPYCNWWQSQPVPAQQAVAVAQAAPALDPRVRNGILSALALGFLLMVAFTIGALFHGSTPAKAAQQAAAAPAQQQSTPRVSVLTVPCRWLA